MAIGELWPQSGLVALYHLNGNSNDSSGNGYNGSDTSISYGSSYGRFGQGANFNGSAYINLGTSLNSIFSSNAWTVFIWAKSTTTTQTFLIANDYSSGNRQFAAGFQNGGQLYMERAGSQISPSSGPTITTNTWYQFGYKYNGTTWYSYLNGAFANSASMSTLPTTSNVLFLGQRQYPGSEQRLSGNMDEVAIFNRALSDAEIRHWYAWSRGKYL